MIIFRYLVKEVLITTAAVNGILLLIFLSNQFVRYLSYAAAGKFNISLILNLMSLEIPFLMGLLLPLALFLGILLAYGRMYTDNEMTVIAACGIGPYQILSMTLKIAAGVAGLVAMLTLFVNPYVVAKKDRLLAQANAASALQTILPGRFQTFANGEKIFYVQQMSVDRDNMGNVFVAEHNAANRNTWSVLSAKSGYQQMDSKTGAVYFVTADGHRYDGVPGSKAFRMIQYKQYGIRIQEHPNYTYVQDEEDLPTFALFHDSKRRIHALAELQWRVSIPLSVTLLAFLAVPLSQIKPRQGKFSQLVPAVLIYIVYANMMFVSRAWVDDGTVPPFIGMWWIHALIFILGLLLLASQAGWLDRRINLRRRRTL